MLVERAFCLCLPAREQYWRELQEQIEDLGIEFIPFLIGTDWQDDPNIDISRWGYARPEPEFKRRHAWAFAAHQEMLRRAKSSGWKSFLLLEDDCIVLKRFQKVMSTLEEEILNLDYDIFYLGYWWKETDYYPEIEKAFREEGIMRVDKVVGNLGGLHSALIKNTAYDFLLSLPPVNPIDYQLNQIGHHRLKTYMVIPKVSHIRTCFSFCEGSVIQREEMT